MNRPNINHYKERSWLDGSTEGYKYEEYIRDLEKYCDKLEGAVDKACKFYHDFYVSDSELTTEQWKEFLLKDA